MNISPIVKRAKKEINSDFFIINNGHSSNFTYLTGIEAENFEGSIFFVQKKGKPIILVGALETAYLKGNKNFTVKSYSTRKEIENFIKKFTSRKTAHFNISELSISTNSWIKKIVKNSEDCTKKIYKLRKIKSKEEIKNIKKAVKITETVLNNTQNFLKKNMKEKDLASRLRYEAELKDGDLKPAFPVIVGSGINSKNIHHVPGTKKISKGILLIDFGARYNNYCADLTRTFTIGKPTKKQNELYEKLYSAKELGISLSVENTNSSKVYKEVCEYLFGKNKKMQHGLGHGVGVDVHDFPGAISSRYNYKFQKNNILAIEPGDYLKSFGMRIEDNILIKQNKAQKLSNAPQKLAKLRL